jgi:hypothetical protein
MNIRKYSPAIVCGFAASVLATVPGIKNFSCCLLIPGAAVFAIFLDKKITRTSEKINISKGVGFGFLTGVVATIFITIFEMLVTYFAKTNDFIQNLPQSELIMRQWNLGPLIDDSLKLMKGMAKQIESSGFSVLYLILIFFSNFIINSLFGMIGGILGVRLANRKLKEEGN